MANYVVSDTSLTAVANAIRLKGGTSAQLEFPDEFVDAIGDIQTGGGSAVVQPLSVTENGTYTAPSGVDGYSPVTVAVQGGETPVPDDGKTRIWIHIAEGTSDSRLTFWLRFTSSVASNTTVDWGDGVSETLGSTTATIYSHKYSQGGDYIITLTVNSGTISFVGSSGSSGASIYGGRGVQFFKRTRIRKVVFGDNIADVGECVFYNCYNLESVVLPDNISNIATYAFSSCYSLESLVIPANVTSIASQAFSNCYNLESLVIPANVTSIGTNAFNTCNGMSEYHFKRTTPPTLENSNAFSSIPSDCIIYVPRGSLNAYKTATNWSSRASQMQEEPA